MDIFFRCSNSFTTGASGWCWDPASWVCVRT